MVAPQVVLDGFRAAMVVVVMDDNLLSLLLAFSSSTMASQEFKWLSKKMSVHLGMALGGSYKSILEWLWLSHVNHKWCDYQLWESLVKKEVSRDLDTSDGDDDKLLKLPYSLLELKCSSQDVPGG
ncbi:hypothetical protein E3N88_04959 [Mikania micrantha]|uniref:Uncharacterized protein n=1 Tax=Mikania micrantha TaxID=192012 RepID=A0A5N6PXY5_9ASTR|nr:hypothetical protein E3N88_04959 [Mikania micrantha]